MSATAKIAGQGVVIDGYRWAGEDDALVGLLNAMLDPGGPSGADPNPDLHAAQAAVEALGGEVVSYDPTEWEEGVVY